MSTLDNMATLTDTFLADLDELSDDEPDDNKVESDADRQDEDEVIHVLLS